MLIKTIDSDDYKFYDKFDSIPIDDLEYIWYLSCSNDNYTNIDFINNIPNLMELDASNNKIKIIPSHDSIQILNINYNELTELPTLINAININASFNKLQFINPLPKIKKLDISNNLLNKIIIEPSLININCSHNIIKIIFCNNKWDYNLETIDCSYNRLNNINFMFILDNLSEIIYNNNFITYMAPHIRRLLVLYNNNNTNDYLYLYRKKRHSINMKQQFKIHNILLKPPIDFNIVINEIVNCNYLSDIAKEQINYYSNFDEPNYKIPINYKELLCCVWTIIRNSIGINKFINNLNYIYKKPHPCRCQSCQLINLSNCMDDNPIINNLFLNV